MYMEQFHNHNPYMFSATYPISSNRPVITALVTGHSLCGPGPNPDWLVSINALLGSHTHIIFRDFPGNTSNHPIVGLDLPCIHAGDMEGIPIIPRKQSRQLRQLPMHTVEIFGLTIILSLYCLYPHQAQQQPQSRVVRSPNFTDPRDRIGSPGALNGTQSAPKCTKGRRVNSTNYHCWQPLPLLLITLHIRELIREER